MQSFTQVVEGVGLVIDGAGVLAIVLGWLIVLIRTFLSMALQIELEGRWPWQGGAELGQRRTND